MARRKQLLNSALDRRTVDKFEKLKGQLQGTYEELATLSKKAPTDAVNTFKLRFVNQLLSQANDLLGDRYKPFDDFTAFDEDAVPQNSDAVFILAQYLHCLEKLRADNVENQYGTWYWKIRAENPGEGDDEGMVYLRTTKPTSFRD